MYGHSFHQLEALGKRYRRSHRLASWMTFEEYLQDPKMYDDSYYGLVIAWAKMKPFNLDLRGDLDDNQVRIELNLN